MTIKEQLEVHHKEAWHWSRQCCRYQMDLADDVLQTAYLKVLEKRALYNDKSSFKTWLFSVVRFTAIDLQKRETTRKMQLGNLELIDAQTHLSNLEDDTNRNYEILIKALPDRQAEVLLLVFYHDLTVEAAAEVMEISLGTARTHYDRGKKKLKELILESELKKAI